MPKPKIIKQDGTTYTFTPGKNGSMSAPAPTPPPVYQGQAKVIGAVAAARKPQTGTVTPEQYAMRRKRSNIAQVLAVRD